MLDSSGESMPVLSHEVREEHTRINAEDYEDIYVIGDVHGCIDELEDLVNKIGPSEEDLLVFVGDLMDEGPDPEAVVRKVRNMDNAISVRGNKEEKLLRGRYTFSELSRTSQEYISSLPVAVSWEDNMVVHGGVLPYKPLNQHCKTEFQETRSVFGDGYNGIMWFERYEEGPRILFGHTVLNAPLRLEKAVGLDTGCVYGGMLTAYNCTKDRFITVEAHRRYRARNSNHIVSTASI